MRLRRRFRSRRGQSAVEFALILPVIMFLMLGMIEMGFAISHNTSIVTATRQGARVGSELVNGSSLHHCGDSTNAATVDAQIIAATEGVLRSPGSQVSVAQVTSIVIFEVNESGALTGNQNTWISKVNGDGTPNGDFIPNTSTHLYFAYNGGNWAASTRCGSSPAHGIGVKITYTYKFVTPLGSVMAAVASNMFSGGTITMSDQTVMALEPPNP
jgi:Flp pilus assembly protein TadG